VFSHTVKGIRMRIATWNVNSVRQRLGHLVEWLGRCQPDIVALQEIKVLDDAFPRLEVESLGYNIETHGQKTFNGVALLSRHRLQDVRRGLPGDDSDEQARYIEAVVGTASGVVRVASIYLPNGNPVPGDKYTYKLAWMDRLIRHADMLLTLEEPVVLAGDYNVIPDERDAKDPSAWVSDALFLPQTRTRFRALQYLGYVEALRSTTDQPGLYSFWDYQAGAWQKNNGIRIDHLLLSPQASDRLTSTCIDRWTRGLDKPSDHVPVRIDLSL
jgi:exodeoxyribonuclease-3